MNTTPQSAEVFEEILPSQHENTPSIFLMGDVMEPEAGQVEALVKVETKLPQKLPKTIVAGRKYKIVSAHSAEIDNTANRGTYTSLLHCSIKISGVLESDFRPLVEVKGGKKEHKNFNVVAQNIVFAKAGTYTLCAKTKLSGKEHEQKIRFTVIQ